MGALNLLGFLKSNWRILALVFGAIALYGAGYARGHHDGKASEQRAEASRLAQARKAVARKEVKAAAISEKAASDLTKEHERIVYRTRTITEKVNVYVPAAADAACVVPSGFVQLYNAAASGGPPGLPAAPGGSVQEPSGVPLSSVLSVTVENFGVAYDWRAEAITWRRWYVEQKAEWGKR